MGNCIYQLSRSTPACVWGPRGFTLMEMLVTIAIAALILAIGAPSFSEFRRNSRLAGTANDFLGVIQTARTEAIKRQTTVSVCPSNNPTDAAPTCSNGNFTGWIAFVEGPTDINCLRTAAVLEDGTKENDVPNLIRSGGPVETQVNARSSGVCISFNGTGFLQDVAGRATAFRTLFCDSRGTALQPGSALSAARQIDVGRTGRSRVTRLPADLADTTLAPVVACP